MYAKVTDANKDKAGGRQVAQSVERLLDVEVRGSKPTLGTGGGVGSHLTSPIRRDVRFLDDQDLGN